MPSPLPHIPDYQLLRCIGRGSYGEVWLARGVTGYHRAVKIVHRSSFAEDRPYEREFSGIKKFQAVSHSQENLVNILHVGRNDEAGYFFYIMELADPAGAVDVFRPPGSDLDAGGYESGTLKHLLRSRGRLAASECLAIAKGLARAIEHLHRNGLIHRDIKPSNVIFVNGVPKLADIGLVAGLDESRSFVGTEGFVPPDGPGTVGADLFALGRLLYEMSTGRDRLDYPKLPEDFDQLADRPALMEFNEVVLKAGDPDIRRRYASADELVRDLLLLEAGKSVRRLRLLENRVAVALRTATAAVVITLLALSAWFWAAYQAREAKHNAAESERHRLKAEAALREVLLNQVRVNRQSGWAGQRFESLSLLREAPTMTNTLPFRNEAIACLSLPDARPFRTIPVVIGARVSLDRQLTRYATNDSAGAIFVRSVDDNRLLQYLPGPGAGIYRFGFAEDDHRIGASYLDRRFAVWDLEKFPVPSAQLPKWSDLPEAIRPKRILLPPGANAGTGLPDGSELAVFCQDNRLHFLNPTNGVESRVATLDGPVSGITFSPNGLKFAGSRSNDCFVYRTSTMEKVLVLPHPSVISSIAWHPDGRRLATACYDFKVRIWDTVNGQQTSAFEDHEAEATSVEFDETGTFLASGSWDDTTRIWAPEPARALVRVRGSGNGLRLAANAERMAYTSWDHSRLVILEVNPGQEFNAFERVVGVYGLSFSPDGKFIVAGSTDGLHIWQWPFFHPIATMLPIRDCPTPAFVPDGSRLYAGGRGVVVELPFRIEDGKMHVGPLHEMIDVPRSQLAHADLSPDASMLAVTLNGGIQIFCCDRGSWNSSRVVNGKGLSVKFGYDPRWLVVQRSGRRAEVLDQKFNAVTNFECINSGVTRFSPDRQWLVLATTNGYETRRLGTWEPGPRLSESTGLYKRECIAFAEHAGIVAVRTGDRDLQLKLTSSWETVATVSIPLTTTAVALSPDGQLLGIVAEKLGLRVWDVGKLRRGLASMGLDWTGPPAASVGRSHYVGEPMLQPMVLVDAPRLTNQSPSVSARILPRPPGTSAALIDLSNYYNASLSDGWIPSFDLGVTAEHTLPLPLGTNRWGGVDFDVRGAIQLSSSTLASRKGSFPVEVSGIPVGRRCRRLHFLHGTDWKVKAGTTIAGYFVRYVTGEEELVRVVYGRDVLDWWMEPTEGTNAPTVAWKGSNPASRRQNASVRVYQSAWENPRWDIPVQSIAFVSAKTACGPFLLAITAD